MSANTFELRQAWRAVHARRGLAAVVVLSLGIGIGAMVMLFAVIDGAILRPFPFHQPDRLIGVGAAYPRLRTPLEFFEVFSGPEYADIKDGAKGLEHLAGFDLGNEPVMVGDSPERMFTAYLWDDLFATLGIAPSIGRSFTVQELVAAAPVAVISDAFWRNRFASASTVIGTRLIVGGRAHEIVGVMPPRARIYGTDLWVPMQEKPEALSRTRRQFNVLARLRPGVTLAEANAALSVTAHRLEQRFGSAVPEYSGVTIEARRWADIDVWGGANVAHLAFAALALLLALLTSNLTSLLFAKAASRRGEMALRVALGASNRTLRRQMLLEAFVQVGGGTLLGCSLAVIGFRLLPSWLPGFLPEDAYVGVSLRMLAFAAILASVIASAVGLACSLQFARARPSDVLSAETGRTTGSRHSRRLQFLIVAFGVANAIVIAGVAAQLTASVFSILRTDPGIDPEGLVMMRITLPLPKYGGRASLAFFDRLLESARTLPSVKEVTLSNQPPPGLFSRSQVAIEGRPRVDQGSLPSAFFTTAGATYREALGLRLTRGRWFDERTDGTSPREVVINESAAAQLFSNQDPIGQRLRIMTVSASDSWAEVVGTIADIRNRGLVSDPQPEIIGSVRQIPERRQSQLYLLVRARSGIDDVVAAVRRAVTAIDPQQPIYAVTTVEQLFRNGVAQRRNAAKTLLVFSALAIAIAGVGVYGVVSHATGERTREICVRLALGSSAGSLRAMIARQAMMPVCVGVAVGLLAQVVGARVVASWVFGIQPDALALGVVTGVIGLVGLVASVIPAWRASRLNPVVALHQK